MTHTTCLWIPKLLGTLLLFTTSVTRVRVFIRGRGTIILNGHTAAWVLPSLEAFNPASHDFGPLTFFLGSFAIFFLYVQLRLGLIVQAFRGGFSAICQPTQNAATDTEIDALDIIPLQRLLVLNAAAP